MRSPSCDTRFEMFFLPMHYQGNRLAMFDLMILDKDKQKNTEELNGPATLHSKTINMK